MKMAILAGAVALAMACTGFDSQAQTAIEQDQSEASGVTLKEVHISRLRTALNLTPDQRPLWSPVEAALREIAKQPARPAAGGIVQRLGEKASAVAGDAVRLRRLASAARPLIKVLDDDQKSEAISLARQLGFSGLMTAL